MKTYRIGLLLTCVSAVACARGEDPASGPTASEPVRARLLSIEPALVLAGTRLEIEGRDFIAEPLGISTLRLTGSLDGHPLEVEIPASFVDFETLHANLTPEVMETLGNPVGIFEGTANVWVEVLGQDARVPSWLLPIELTFVDQLAPTLLEAQSGGAIFVNDRVSLTGENFLLGPGEGNVVAVVSGCFQPTGESSCGGLEEVTLPIAPAADHPLARDRAVFAFEPAIAGIRPGHFDGDVFIRNRHIDGTTLESIPQPFAFELLESEIRSIGPGGSLGQFIDIEGGGFVGGPEGYTLVEIEGEFTSRSTATEGGSGEGMVIPVPPLELVPEFQSGRRIRYILNEDDLLAQALAAFGGVRTTSGEFRGTIVSIIGYRDDERDGRPFDLTFRVEPVKQIVHVVFTPSYVESLRRFGLRALDVQVRERVFEVLRRDFATINVEFRSEPPQDFKLFASIEIGGPDPNGLGLLGYDNTPGKDYNNERLFDRIGGVNAQTQEDGYPGFGGIFVESLFPFSSHPPEGISTETPSPWFDEIFDPLRPDTGTPINSSDEGFVPLTGAEACPADDRATQIACAIWVMGSLIGTTASHELGHSLGLADPEGTRFHYLGDTENALMDAGGARPFEERAELNGQGPAVFCESSYDYLRGILPTMEPRNETRRPDCG